MINPPQDKPDAEPYFVRGEDGILTKNPRITLFDRSPYQEPNEALNVFYGGVLRLGCNHRMFGDYRSYPCGNAPKHDPDANGRPTKCGHHSKAANERRKAKSQKKYEQWRKKLDSASVLKSLKDEMLPLIQSIADGHNDPRSACGDFLSRYNEAIKPDAGRSQ